MILTGIPNVEQFPSSQEMNGYLVLLLKYDCPSWVVSISITAGCLLQVNPGTCTYGWVA
jgi:hypothetical protein